ncbi:MAG: hypothetical protein WC975_15385 [Phycisphaerae bacterium]
METRINRIEYRQGMLEENMKPSELSVRLIQGPQITDEIRQSIEKENIFELGGVYGDKKAGDPIEYDHLKIVFWDRTVEIEFFNRGITLLATDSEIIRRIHRVMCKVDGRFGKKD